MALQPIKIPAGFFRNATQYQAKNRWYKGNLVRFSEGRLRPIGGWQRLADTRILKSDGVTSLKITNEGSSYTYGGTLFAGTKAFTATDDGSDKLLFTCTAHGLSNGDLIQFNGQPESSSADTLPLDLDPNTNYWVLGETTNTFYVGTTSTTSTKLGYTVDGSGYITAGITGSGFSGTFAVSGGKIVDTAIVSSGSGYTTTPTIVMKPTSPNSSGSSGVITATTASGTDPIRGLHSWRLSTGARYLAVGSVQSLRIWDGSQSAGTNAPLYTITPATGSGPTGAVPFSDQQDFLIAGLGYGALEYGGDLGVTLFDDSTGATSGGSTYGGPRYPAEDPDVTDIDAFRDNFAPVWSLDNFGDDLLACHSGEGTIWHWAIATGGPSGGAVAFTNTNQTASAPVQLANAPISNVAVLVTPERHIMVLGAGGNQRRIQWAHQEGLTGTANWTPSLTNTAGDLDLQTKGRIVGGFKTRYGVLVFTTSDVWKTNYLGPPYVYGVERLTEGGGPVGMKCIAGSADFVAWMSRGRFWSFTGGYVKELTCDVADYVFSDINLDVEGLIAAGHNSDFGEIIWFYPKEGDEYCTRYVTYSYREQHWTTGELERTALESPDALGYPVWAGADGYLYRHEMDPDTQSTPIPRNSAVTAPADVVALSTMESRVVAKGVDIGLHPNVSSEEHLCYAESGAIEIGAGDKMMNVTQILTDSNAGTSGLRLKTTTADTPDGTGIEKGPYILENDGYTDTRFTGRQAFLKVESPFDQEWRFGEVRFDTSVAGER